MTRFALLLAATVSLNIFVGGWWAGFATGCLATEGAFGIIRFAIYGPKVTVRVDGGDDVG